jgi:phage terminase small subunit
MANEEKLDPKHRKFLDLYLETGNIADSYVGAGYQCSSDSACAGGSRLLRKLDEELNHLEVF